MISDLTKPALLGLLLSLQTLPPPLAPASHFRYQRRVKLSSSPAASQACAVLEGDVFAHSASSLKDLRLYSGQTEIPYVTTLSEPLQQEVEEARIHNLRSRSGHILFDLEMPRRPYTGLALEIAARDYVAKALVSGSAAVNGKNVTRLGVFSLFDLSSQHLSHATHIPLPESTFPYLHVDLFLSPASGSATRSASLNSPEIVKGVIVPPSREAQSLYTTTQEAEALQQGQESVATFKVQSRVPIERVSFILLPNYKGNFSRDVRIEAHATVDEVLDQEEKPGRSGAAFYIENVTGNIFSVHKAEGGQELSAENLSIPVAIGSNMQQPAIVEARIEDGSAVPLPISVELQMRQRQICFDTHSANAPLVLFYGDPSLDAPAYTDASLKQAAAHPGMAKLEPETENPALTATTASPKFKRHRPILRWIALLGCVCIFALLVFRRSAKHKQY